MKAILEFSLDDHDDELAHKRCVKSLDMALVLFDMSYNVRKQCEDELDSGGMNIYGVLDLVFGKYQALMDEHNINIDDLVE